VLARALREHLQTLEKRRFGGSGRSRQRGHHSTNPRYIPAPVRRKVWLRDGGQCAFVSESGRRCTSRERVEIDHLDLVGRRSHPSESGPPTAERLRLVCQAHIAGQSPRLQRGGQVPSRANPHEPDSLGSGVMGRPNASKQTRHVASEPSPEARAKPRAAPKGNALAPSWQTGRISLGEPGQGGRADCVPAKTAATVDAWGNEAVATLGV
jgi:hypothetical protein